MSVLRNPQIFWGGVYVSALSSALSMETEIETQDSTNFASGSTREFVPSFTNNAVSFEGQVYASTYEKLDRLTTDTDSVEPFSVAIEDAEGSVAYSVLANEQSFATSGAIGELVNVSVAMFTKGKCKRGILAFNREIDASAVSVVHRLVKVSAGGEIDVVSHVYDIESGVALTLELSDEADFSNIVDTILVADLTAVGATTAKVTSSIAKPYARVVALANASADAAVFLF